MNLSGRGDKDTDIYRENFKELDNARHTTHLSALFAHLRERDAQGLIAYITAGDPSPTARPNWSARSSAAAPT